MVDKVSRLEAAREESKEVKETASGAGQLKNEMSELR